MMKPLTFSADAGFTSPSIVHGTTVESGGKIVVKLAHEYPDFQPQVGWLVRGRGIEAIVTHAREGQLVHCSRG